MKTPPSAAVSIPPAEARVFKLLAEEARRRGLPLYAVGGCVRDWALGRRTFDLDLAVVGDPGPVAERCARLLKGRAESFGKFGTRRVVGPGRLRVDVATTRSEEYPQPASLPRLTARAVPIERDLVRRDFTINAMAVRLDDGSRALIDPCGGMRDLKARTLRVLHPASFRDDPTRVFRAARFIGRLRCRPAEEMSEQAREALRAGHAAKLSRHRLLHELVCLLGERDPGFAFALLETWGYLPLLHPDLPWRRKLPTGVEPRLAALALALGPSEGMKFIDSFPFDHRLRGLLHDASRTVFSVQSPRKALPPEVRAWVRRALPELPPAALKPCFVQGEDVIAAGVPPGPSFRAILDEAAALQRRGRLKTRAAALAWLRRR